MSHLQGDQRRRWARGERVLVEDYLKEFADLLGDPEVLLDLIYHEVIVREEFGDAPGLEEYLDRFPQFARQLGDQFELHAALNDTQWLDKGGATGLDPVTTLANAGRAASGAWPSIPGYELIRELGRGGMGVVYLAWQTGLNRLTALKMILAGDFTRMRDRVRFCNEAEAVARLEHPNLVRIYEIGEQDGRPYFSMEYVPGGSLAHALRSTPLPPGKAAALAQTLARAAHAVHERAVVHRDLTPNNVLLGADGDPKIVDFGLAKLVVGGADQTESGDILGTPSYMAPEQAGGRSKEVGPAADVYALGAILYEMLTGRPPFKAETPLETLLQVVNHDPVAPRRLQPKLPRDLETVCLKCLEKDPTKRYATAQAFADDLARFLAGEPILARQVGAWGRVVKWAKRRPAIAALLVVCAVGALAAFAAVTWEGRQARLAQGRAEAAQAAEKLERLAADEARQRETKERLLYQGVTARLLRDRALRHCNEGDVGRGLLWLAESLRLVPENDPELGRAIHTNLTGWQTQLHPLRALLEHQGRVMAAAWSPDGRLVLTACTDRNARLWNAASGELHGKPLRLPRGVSRAAFSPDGKMILAVAGQEVWLWTMGAHEPVFREVVDLGRGSGFLSHAFSRDGRRLWMAVRRGQTAWLHCWQADAHPSVGEPVELGQGVTQLIFSPDGRSFVTAGETSEVTPRLWSSITGKPVRDLKEHTHRVYAIAFNPTDGRSFITGSYDNTCRLWDTQTGEPLRTPLRHPVPVRSVAFSPNGRTILTGCGDGSAQFWDVLEGTSAGAPMRHPDALGPVEFSPDGRLALTVSWDQVRIWDATTGEPVGAPLPHQMEVLAASFSPDGKTVLTRCRDNHVRIWQTATAWSAGRRLAHAGWVTAIAFQPPASESFVTGIGASEGKVLSWNVASPQQPRVELDGIGPVLSIAFHPGGRIVAAGTRSHEVWLQDIGTGRLERTGPIELDDRVWSVAFSPDGKTLLAGIEKHRAEFWDVGTMRKLPQPLEHEKAVYAVAYSPDGQTVLTGSEDMTARLWDAMTHQPQGTPLMHEGTVYAVAFQPPGGKLVLTGSGDRTARLWETSTGRPVGEPLQHSARVLAVAFSPDGRLIATGCGDGTVHFWDAVTGHPIGFPLRHHGPVRAVAFGHNPQDSTAEEQRSILVTASEDKTARIWKVPAPSTESAERIMLSLQVANGLELDSQGIARSLEPAAWRRLGRDMHDLVSPPR